MFVCSLQELNKKVCFCTVVTLNSDFNLSYLFFYGTDSNNTGPQSNTLCFCEVHYLCLRESLKTLVMNDANKKWFVVIWVMQRNPLSFKAFKAKLHCMSMQG